RPEYRHAVGELRQVFEPLDKLAHDSEYPPGVSVQKLVCPRCLEQALVLCAAPTLLKVTFSVHFVSLRPSQGRALNLDSHHVVTTVDMDRFAGNPGRERTAKKQRRVADFPRLDVTMQRGPLS